MSCGVGHRCSSDLVLLWRRLAAVALTGPPCLGSFISWGCGPKKQKKKKKILTTTVPLFHLKPSPSSQRKSTKPPNPSLRTKSSNSNEDLLPHCQEQLQAMLRCVQKQNIKTKGKNTRWAQEQGHLPRSGNKAGRNHLILNHRSYTTAQGIITLFATYNTQHRK